MQVRSPRGPTPSHSLICSGKSPRPIFFISDVLVNDPAVYSLIIEFAKPEARQPVLCRYACTCAHAYLHNCQSSGSLTHDKIGSEH